MFLKDWLVQSFSSLIVEYSISTKISPIFINSNNLELIIQKRIVTLYLDEMNIRPINSFANKYNLLTSLHNNYKELIISI